MKISAVKAEKISRYQTKRVIKTPWWYFQLKKLRKNQYHDYKHMNMLMIFDSKEKNQKFKKENSVIHRYYMLKKQRKLCRKIVFNEYFRPAYNTKTILF